MKHLKKLMALILATCMLIGMPLSLDVAATGQPNSGSIVTPFRAAQALLIPKQWNTGLDTEHTVSLYFTGDVTIDTATTKAYIVLVNASGLATVVDPITEKIDYSANITTIWDVSISRSTALGARNNYVVTLDPHTTRNYHHNCDTIAEILYLAQKTGLKPVVRLRETTAALNNSLSGIYDTNDNALASTPNGVDQGGCTETGLVRQTSGGATAANHAINCYDYVDIPLTDLSHAPSLKYVESNGTMIRSIFSHAMYWDGRSNSANPTHLRVVNSKGQIMYTNGTGFKNEKEAASASGYYAIGNYNNNTTDLLGLCRNTFFISGQPSTSLTLSSIPHEGTTYDWTTTYNNCLTQCAALNRSRYGGETYTVALVIEENESNLYNNNGDAVNNWRIDGMWAEGYTPLTATHSNASLGINDRVIVPVRTPAETDAAIAADPDAFTLKHVSVSSMPGQADRVLVEFSKPVSSLSYNYAGIRLYASSGWVVNNNVQWRVGSWQKHNADGTQWIGTINTAFECNTLDQIQSYLVSQGYASDANGSFTVNNGYRLEFAFADPYGAANDRILTGTRAADGSYLYANDSPFLTKGEDRAGISYAQFERINPVNIEDVTIYANKYVLIDFDQDITWWADLNTFYNGLCVYDQQHHNLAATNGSDYSYLGASGYTTNLQKVFTSWTYYGNRKDIVVATLADGDYEWLTEHLNNANNGSTSSRFDLRLRLQDKPDYMDTNSEYAVDAITSLNSELSHLYSSYSGNWSTVYFEAVHHSDETSGANFTQAQLIASNKAILSFSTAIKEVNINNIYLVDGNTTYPITSAEVNGNNVTVTFDGVTIRDGMGIRISGADYRIPASTVTTLNGSVIYANESETSAYLPAVVTEAIASVKLNDTYYIDFQTAWAQRKDGDTLQLFDHLDQTKETALVVPAGVTLDLNGHTLTVPYFMSFGNVVDSTDGDGLIKVGKNTPSSFAKLQAENTYLSLYDTPHNGYRFFSYDIENLGVKEFKNSDDVVTSLKYGIRLHFQNTNAYTLLSDAANADVNLIFTFTIRYPNATSNTLLYTFSHSTLSTFAQQYVNSPDKAITLTVSGMESLASKAEGQPTSISIDTHSTILSGSGVQHVSTDSRYNLGITPAQAAVNWITERLENNDLVSFNYDNSPANLSSWTRSQSGDAISVDSDWTRIVTYTKSNTSLKLTISFNKEHASLEWRGDWTHTGWTSSKRIANVRILNAPFTMNGAVLTTANQGGQNYIYDYQPYSIDLTRTSHSMANTGGRSSQGAWPYFDLTSAHNTYGIMGAIGWTGNWMCDFTYNNGAVTVEAGMQTTDYQMKHNETLRTPSMVIQFFKGTQDDGHNAWRQLILDQYTPDDVHTYGENNTPCAPISINTWGGIGESKMLDILNNAEKAGQYFEYQWIDAGWYGDYLSEDVHDTITVNGVTDSPWHLERGDWYYNPGFTTADTSRFYGGFDKLNKWHEEYGKDTGLIVWFEPGRTEAGTKMANACDSNGSYTHPVTGKVWKNSYSLEESRIVDYGITEAREYFEELILHFLKDMNATYYRQDYNIDPAVFWTYTDDTEEAELLTPDHRDGVAEIKYVTGHYLLLDNIRAAGYQIDNCASGGRLLDIEMMKRSIPLWRTDYTGTGSSVASGIRSQGANLSWWLPISGGMGSSEGLNTEYGFRSTMASGVTMNVLSNATHADKMINELLYNREMMLGDYYILQQGLHEGIYHDSYWKENDASKDYTNTTNAAYEYYLEEQGKGYLVAFRPTYSDVETETFKLKGLDAHADYEVRDADTGETFIHTGR